MEWWKKKRALGCFLFLGIGFSLSCSGPRIRYRLLEVAYLPSLVKGIPRFPPQRVLVLLPQDKRKALLTKGGRIPPVAQRELPRQGALVEENLYLVGFLGTSSKGSLFMGRPSRLFAPDRPRLVFYMADLKGSVQKALVEHLREANLQAVAVSFTMPSGLPAGTPIQAHFALGSSIEEFSLASLLYYVEARPSGRFYPFLGPTRAKVVLALTLYRWPSGELLWRGKVAESLADPPAGDDVHLYGSMGEVMSVALSRAVGSFLITEEVRDLLLGEAGGSAIPAQSASLLHPAPK